MISKAVLLVTLALLLVCGAIRAADYKFIPRQRTPGNEITCDQGTSDGKLQPFCHITGGVDVVANACDANPECKGFDMEGDSGGYLKGAAGQGTTQYTEGFSHYCKLGAPGNNCEGDWTARRRADIVGNEVDCNAKSYQGEKLDYCQVSGSIVDVASACTANPNCKAFSVSKTDSRLKRAANPITYTEGTTLYVKA